jgi:chemotaxis response regulator CheB
MRVLIIEDEKDLAQVLKVGLEEENHLVSLAFDGVSGLEVARACDFDVIVLDVMLPKLDGFEVARRFSAVPVVRLQRRNREPGPLQIGRLRVSLGCGASRCTFFRTEVAVELAKQSVAVFLGPVRQVSDEVLDLLAGGFA